jgi:hypothetical protein
LVPSLEYPSSNTNWQAEELFDAIGTVSPEKSDDRLTTARFQKQASDDDFHRESGINVRAVQNSRMADRMNCR